jgi:hypothetical protein
VILFAQHQPLPHYSLLIPQEHKRNRPQIPSQQTVFSNLHRRQLLYLLLYIGGKVKQIHNLCEPRASNLTESQPWQALEKLNDVATSHLSWRLPPAKTVAGRFPTPTGSRWSDLEIRFCNSEKISVRICDQRQVLTFSQLGLVDSRSGKELLLDKAIRKRISGQHLQTRAGTYYAKQIGQWLAE